MTTQAHDIVTEPNGQPEGEPAAPKVLHFSPDERAARGKAARADAPRTSHSALDLTEGRDPVGLLELQTPFRVADLVPIRYGRMLVSPFTFYRGAASVMAHDLASTPRSGLQVQLCGDAHLANFGFFASPERSVVFDLNDFDETHRGPFEWDVKRLAASFEVAGRDRGFTDAERRTAVLEVVKAYREAMREFAAMRNLDLWYARIDAREFEAKLRAEHSVKEARALARGVEKAQTKDSVRALARLTQEVDGEVQIVSSPPLIVPMRELADAGRDVEHEVRELVRIYRRTLQRNRRELLETFRYVDVARKVVGVGSVGTRCWIMLMLGRDNSDPLFLQAKEAGPSVLTEVGCKSDYANEGQRVVAGQRFMQASSDIFLGWQRVTGVDGVERDFYIRQLRDWKGSVQLENANYEGMLKYGEVCAITLARAHARSGDRIAISAYLGETDHFDRAMAEYAEAYADQNERDYNNLVGPAKDARITVESGL